MPRELVWLITGTSSGLGRLLALEAIKRGDRVIATTRARSIHKLDGLRQRGADVLELEVTAPLEELHEVAKQAVAIYGRMDVLVNNAGYYCAGALEETTPQETYDQFNTNVFGGLNIIWAFLPYIREGPQDGDCRLAQFNRPKDDNIGAFGFLANAGLYNASKAATRSLSVVLGAELVPIGLRSLVFEFGFFHTGDLNATQRMTYVSRIADYQDVCGAVEAAAQAVDGNQLGDPEKGVQVMVDVIRGEGKAAGKVVPMIVHLGSDIVRDAAKTCNETLQRIDEWKDMFISTDFPEGV